MTKYHELIDSFCQKYGNVKPNDVKLLLFDFWAMLESKESEGSP